MAVQADGKVMVGGNFAQLNGQPVFSLGRLNSDGSFDATFTSAIDACVTCDAPQFHGINVLTNGQIVVNGSFSRVSVFTMNGLSRLNANGSADGTFVPIIPADQQVSAVAVSSNGVTTAAITYVDPNGGTNLTRFLRFNLDGSLDSGFKVDPVVGDPSASNPVTALAIDTSGRTVLAGRFVSIGSTNRHNLARLNMDGTLDANFDAGAGLGSTILPTAGNNNNSLVSSLALQENGGILVGGGFASVNGQVRLGLVRFQADQGAPPPPSNQPKLSAAARATDGTFTMLVSGNTGQTYEIDASSDLRTWAKVGTVTGATTPQPFSDSGAKTLPMRFYRALAQ
jgi:uncharacterized delta-60 repeat protein